MAGIIAYGTYIPQYRLKLADIAAAWRKEPTEIIKSLGLIEKSVPGIDEDAVTVAVEAALRCFAPQGKLAMRPSDIEALFVGSESHPYAVNPTSTIVGELLGIGNNYLAADLEFACKAGTAGMQAIAGLIESRHISCGMSIGADTAQGKPHDVLEYTSAAAGVAFLLGRAGETEEKISSQFLNDRQNIDYLAVGKVIAKLLSYTSYSSDTPDFWRRDGMQYPSHSGRFTGEPAYFTHVVGAADRLFKEIKLTPDKIDYCVFHMPNGKFPRDVARRLGFTPAQLAPSLTVEAIGNPYSASSMLGLAAVLDQAKPNQTIFMVSYGSGAGSDAFLWKTTTALKKTQKLKFEQGDLVKQQIQKKTYVDYTQYLKQTHKI